MTTTTVRPERSGAKSKDAIPKADRAYGRRPMAAAMPPK